MGILGQMGLLCLPDLQGLLFNYDIGVRYGDWKGRVGENISFGDKTGIEAIVSLIIDDGF